MNPRVLTLRRPCRDFLSSPCTSTPRWSRRAFISARDGWLDWRVHRRRKRTLLAAAAAATPTRGKAMFHKTTHSLLQNKSPLNKCHMHNQATGIIIIVISFSTGRPMWKWWLTGGEKGSAQTPWPGPRARTHMHACTQARRRCNTQFRIKRLCAAVKRLEGCNETVKAQQGCI